MSKTITTMAIAAMVLRAVSAMAATPADKCQAIKNKTAGAYYSCREKAEATAIAKALPADYGKCTSRFDSSWDKAETSGAGACPDHVTLTADMNAFIAAQAADAALVVAGAPIPDCAGDLATCEAQPLGQVHRTGQTTCYNAAGGMIACAGTGQDGQFLKGLANTFTDNGDGTITDNLTGLMWEKLDNNNAGGIHDWDDTYTWTTAFTTKIAMLNSAVFAGHNDWRLPNRNELLTLTNIGTLNPATFPAFHAACVPGCTVTNCSCTQSDGYWTSSPQQGNPTFPWTVYFDVGVTGGIDDNNHGTHVRAVRSGS